MQLRRASARAGALRLRGALRLGRRVLGFPHERLYAHRVTELRQGRTEREGDMRLRAIFVSVATAGLMVGPAFAHGILNSVAGAAKDCTIVGTAADDSLSGTTRADVIC